MESNEQHTNIVENLIIGEGAVIDQDAIKEGTVGYMKEGAMTTEQGMGRDASAAAFKPTPPESGMSQSLYVHSRNSPTSQERLHQYPPMLQRQP